MCVCEKDYFCICQQAHSSVTMTAESGWNYNNDPVLQHCFPENIRTPQRAQSWFININCSSKRSLLNPLKLTMRLFPKHKIIADWHSHETNLFNLQQHSPTYDPCCVELFLLIVVVLVVVCIGRCWSLDSHYRNMDVRNKIKWWKGCSSSQTFQMSHALHLEAKKPFSITDKE